MLSGLLGKRASTNAGSKDGPTSPTSAAPAKTAAKKAVAEDPTKKRKVYKQGLLKKQGGSHGGWKTWHTRDGVSYYKDEQAYIKGEKELGFLQQDANLAFKNHDEAAERFFRIQSSGRAVVVKAKTMDIKRDWLAIMTKIKDETSSLDALLSEVSKGGTIEGKVNQKPILAPPVEVKEEKKIEIKMLSNSLKEGLMKKAGGQVQNWKSRYFVLMKTALDYYKDETAKTRKGSIPFTKDTTVTVINLPHTFCVTPSPGGRKYVIEAASDEERDQWMTAMHALPDIRFTVVFPEKRTDASSSTGEHERILEDILYQRGDDGKERHADFLNFAKSIFSEENVMFWLDVQRFKTCDDVVEQNKIAESINTKYLTPGSEFEVAAPPEVKLRLSADIESKTLTPAMFESVQKACLAQIVVDVMPKYMSRSLGDIADASKAALERAEQEKKVDCVPLEQLVSTLTNVKSVDNVFFRRAFLLYHRGFMTSDELFTRLEAAYTASDTGEPKLAIPSKLHIVSILQEWIRFTKFFDMAPIYPRASRTLRKFREDASLAMAEDMTKEAEKGPFLLASELQALVCMIEEAKDDHETKMKAAADTVEDGERTEAREDICDYSPQAIAECLTVTDYQLFSQLQYREFFDKAWQRKDIASTTSRTILRMIDVFNDIGTWVASEVLNREDAGVRSQTIGHFINVCWELKKLHNFFCLFAVWAGLNMQPIVRLKKAHAALSTRQKEAYDILKKGVTDQGFNWRAYRKLFKLGLGRPQMPHLAVVTKDCFLLEEIPTFEKNTGNVNFGKYMKQYSILVDVFQCQKVDYPITPDARLTEVLRSLQKKFVLSNDKMWQRSYRFEPKPTDQ